MPKEEINEKTAERLLLAAREARKNSYSPYSLYPVGAAVLAEINAQSDPGVVFKFFSASQQSMRSI